MRSTFTLTAALVCAFLPIPQRASPLAAQEAGTAAKQDLRLPDLDVESRRPLDDAFSSIEDSLHEPLNFEEIRIVDRSQLISGEEVGMPKGQLFPKGGRLVVHYVANESNALSAVHTALLAYERAHLPGPYTVTEGRNSISVYPSAYPSLFTTTISIPRAERTIGATLQLIVDEMVKVSKKRVVILNQPYMDGAPIEMGAESEPVLRLFEQLNADLGPTSFRFIYDSPSATYYLNLNALRTFVPKDSVDNGAPAATVSQKKLTSSPFFVKTKP